MVSFCSSRNTWGLVRSGPTPLSWRTLVIDRSRLALGSQESRDSGDERADDPRYSAMNRSVAVERPVTIIHRVLSGACGAVS